MAIELGTSDCQFKGVVRALRGYPAAMLTKALTPLRPARLASSLHLAGDDISLHFALDPRQDRRPGERGNAERRPLGSSWPPMFWLIGDALQAEAQRSRATLPKVAWTPLPVESAHGT